MSRRWARLAGDTDRFAIELAFEHDPEDGAGETPEVSASWGAFRLWAGGRNLCAHEEDGEQVDAVHWYLLPLLEWFVDHWDELLHEYRPPSEHNLEADGWSCLMEHRSPPGALDDDAQLAWLARWQEWWRRHDLQAARHGGLFPSVFLRRRGYDVEVSWGPARLTGAPGHFRFTAGRDSLALPPEEVARPLFDAISEAVDQLRSWQGDTERLARLQERLDTLHAPERGSRRLALLAGWAAERWQGFVEAARSGIEISSEALDHLLRPRTADGLVVIGSCEAPLMFGSLAPDLSDSDSLELARHLVAAFETDGEDRAIDQLTRRPPSSSAEPWRQGYDLAEEVLADERIPSLGRVGGSDSGERGGPVDVESILEELGVRVDDVELSDAGTRGVAFAGPDHYPTVLVNRSHPAQRSDEGRRFTLAHELCHLLFDRAKGRRLSMASGPWAPADIEKRANAFAAMFLMPVERLRHLVADKAVDGARVREIATQLGTSYTATLEHLTNLGFLTREQRDEIDYSF